MIPIVPVIMLIVILALYQHYRQDGFWFKHRGLMQGVLGFTLVVNVILLIPLCFNYSHRGLVEPLARIEQSDPAHSHITFVTSDAARIFPLDYGGLTLPGRRYIRSWTDLPDSSARTDYYFLYPNSAEDLRTCRPISIRSTYISGRSGRHFMSDHRWWIIFCMP
jgi:hypothetical protein